MTHYLLPDGPVAIQFSGGRTSGYMLWHILDAYDGKLPADCHVLFQNTGREMPQTLDFVQRCGAEWGVEIVWLQYHPTNKGRFERVNHNSAARNGEPFEALLEKREYRTLPTRVGRWCTGDLKQKPGVAFLNSLGFREFKAVLGIRADEKHRAKPGGDKNRGITGHLYPLICAGIGKRDVELWWTKQPFDLALPNINGKTPLGNCDGCFLKSEANRAWLARYMPERAEWWAQMEERSGASFQLDQAGGTTWRQMIETAQRQPDWVFDQNADVFCNASFGGCHD